MIPKIIHYCWFGNSPLPELTVKCIESWKRNCPDYEIMFWDESNFDVNEVRFCREAYMYKKYAFVADYVRLWALYNHGGIYLDTDMEMLKKISPMLNLSAFIGLESDYAVGTAIIGCVKKHKWISELLHYYKDRSFIRPNGAHDTKPNPQILTANLESYGFTTGNKFQVIKDFLTIYPIDYFYPLSYETKEISLTKNSYCIHHYAATWCNKRGANLPKFIEVNYNRCVKLIRLLYKPILKYKRVKL
ncbi:MAG: glycosyltransferase [Rikenellaceae bacterium]